MTEQRVAVVTGANKGIGLAIVRNLALEYQDSPLKSGELLIYLTARSEQSGHEALSELKQDQRLHGLLRQNISIKFQVLDISSTKSIQDFRGFLRAEHPDGIDALINNAGIATNDFDYNSAKLTLQTNYYGTLEATQDLLPSIKAGGRLVNVSSTSGNLDKYSPQLRENFLTARDVPAITALMEDFKSAVKAGKVTEVGYPTNSYAVSKAGVTAFTRIIAAEQRKKGNSVLINACCPGYVNTDMTKGRGVKTPDQGAQTPVLLALGNIRDTTGQFWKDEQEAQWA